MKLTYAIFALMVAGLIVIIMIASNEPVNYNSDMKPKLGEYRGPSPEQVSFMLKSDPAHDYDIVE